MFNLDDIRILLAIARRGTLSGAAETLGLHQTTVSRRLDALEQALGTRLFDRIDRRMQPTRKGEAMLAQAERVEQEALTLEALAERADMRPAGNVRIAGVESLLSVMVAPFLGQLWNRYPDIAVELVAGNENLHLSRREADIALRLARPVSGDVTMRRIGVFGFALYGPSEVEEGASSISWGGYDEELDHVPEQKWLMVRAGHGSLRLKASSAHILAAAACRAGLRVMLPCCMGDRAAGLTRLSGPEPAVCREIWLLVHRQIRHVARVGAVIDWLVETAEKESAFLRNGHGSRPYYQSKVRR